MPGGRPPAPSASSHHDAPPLSKNFRGWVVGSMETMRGAMKGLLSRSGLAIWLALIGLGLTPEFGEAAILSVPRWSDPASEVVALLHQIGGDRASRALSDFACLLAPRDSLCKRLSP